MSTRNTPVLREIVDVLFAELDEQGTALNRLEGHFHGRLLVDAGNVVTVGEYAEQLRLRITEDERSVVLDYIADQKMMMVTIDHVEAAINELFEGRFTAPCPSKGLTYGIPANNSFHEQSKAVFKPQSTFNDGFVPLPASSSCR